MEYGITYVEFILGFIVIALVVIAVLIDQRNGKRNRRNKEDVRNEIKSRLLQSKKSRKKI